MNKIDILVEKGYSDVIIFNEPDYSDAIIGITDKNEVVYDFYLMIEWLINNWQMNEEEAADFICYNDSFYYGEYYPIILYDSDDEDNEYEKIEYTKIEDL